jgi:twinkle protein
MTDLIEGSFRPLKKRRIRLDACKLYGFRCAKIDDDYVYAADYRDAHGVVAQQVRKIDDKYFYWNGRYAGAQLFGQHLWQAGGKRLVIAKSDIDCLTIAQAFNLKWPVVSAPGCENAVWWIKKNYEWASSFKEIVLAFDETESGRKATDDVGSLFPPGRVRIMDYRGYRDANEMLMENAGDLIAQQVFQAKDYRPDGIVYGEELWDDIITPPPEGLMTPYPILNDKLRGIRQGRIYLLTAGSGLGKSTIAHEIGYDLLTNHHKKLGVFAFEEPRKRVAERYLAFPLGRPIHVDRSGVTEEELKAAFDQTINNKNFALYDHRGSKDIDSVLSKVRYMVVGLEREWIIFDHISIVVSGLDEVGESERKTIDRLMTGLSSMVEELDFGLIAIVHLKRKEKGKAYNEGRPVSLSDLRGSGGLEQMSHAVISLERNQQDEKLKHYSQLRILKDRDIGDTGLADVLEYNPESGRLLAAEGVLLEEVKDGPFDNRNEAYDF